MTPSAKKKTPFFVLSILAAAFFWASATTDVRAQFTPQDLVWTGAVSTDMLNAANWQGANPAFPSPTFLIGNNLIFRGVATRNCVYAPPKGNPSGGFDFSQQSLFVNSIRLASDFQVFGAPNVVPGRFTIQATEQKRASDPPVQQGDPTQARDFAGIITNELLIQGGVLELRDTAFTQAGATGEKSSIAEIIVAGPATMSGGTLNLVHQTTTNIGIENNLERVQARLVLTDRRDQNSNRIPGFEGDWNWSGGTINFQSPSNEVSGDKRATLELEGDWNQSGGTMGTGANARGVVSFNNTARQQFLNTGSAPNNTATFPAVQFVDQNITLPPGQKIRCFGVFKEFGDPITSSLNINGTLTLQGSASPASGDPDVLMVGGLAIGPDVGSGLTVGDNRRVRGDGGTFTLLEGFVNQPGTNSVIDIRGIFFVNHTTINAPPATMSITGQNATFRLAGWVVEGNPNFTEFVATFDEDVTLVITGGNPASFITSGQADVTWPGRVELSQNNFGVFPFAQWIAGPNSNQYNDVVIGSTPWPFRTGVGSPIFVENLTIQGGSPLGWLDVANNQTVQVTNSDISNAGFVQVAAPGSRFVAPSSSLFLLNAGVPVSAYRIGQTVVGRVIDSDKNLKGFEPDTLIGPGGVGLVKIEIFNFGALAEVEEFSQETGPRSFVETGNLNFVFENPGMPLLERTANDSVSNDGELKAVAGDTLRITYSDPNGDQLTQDVPILAADDDGDTTLRFPDLIIEDFNVNVVNQDVTVNALIRNQGTAPSNETKFGLFTDRDTAPVNGLEPDFEFSVPRISPFLAADTLNPVTSNDDSAIIPPFTTNDVVGAPAPQIVNASNSNPIVLPAVTPPLSLKNANNTGVSWLNGGSPIVLPGLTGGTLVKPFDYADQSAVDAATTIQDRGGATQTVSRGTGADSTEGTSSLGIAYNFNGTAFAQPGVVVNSGSATLPREFTHAELVNGIGVLRMDIKGNAGLQSTNTTLEVRVIDTDGDLFRFQAVNPAPISSATFTNGFRLSYVNDSSTRPGDGNLGAVNDLDIRLLDSPGRTMSGTVFYDNARFIEPAHVILEDANRNLVLAFLGNDGATNTVINPGPIPNTVPVRLRLEGGSTGFNIGASTMTVPFTGTDTAVISIPARNLASGAEQFLHVSAKGATHTGADGPIPANLTTARLAGDPSTPPFIQLEQANGNDVLEFRGNDGSSNNVTNPAALGANDPIRVRVNGGDNGVRLILPANDIILTDGQGRDRLITLPSINIANNQERFFWLSDNGTSYNGTAGQTEPVFTSLARGEPIRQSALSFSATSGTTYFIAVDGKRTGAGLDSVSTGDIVLRWGQAEPSRASTPSPIGEPDPPDNDLITEFQEVVGAAGTANGNNVNATKQPGEPNHAGNEGGKSIWFSWTATATGTFFFDTLGSEPDTLLAIYTAPEPVLNVSHTFSAFPPGDFNSWGFIDVRNTENEVTGESNNAAGPVPFSVAAPPGFGPDLVIDELNVTVDPNIEGRVVYEMVVRNGGSQAASDTFVILFFNLASAPTGATPGNQALFVEALGPTQSRTVSFTRDGTPPGDFQAWAFIDQANTTAETNENNNVRGPVAYNVPIPPSARPDYRLDSITPVVSGTDVTYEIVVTNVGNDNAPATQAAIFFDRPGPPTFGTAPDGFINVPSLGIGASSGVLSGTFNNFDPKVYTSWGFVDNTNSVEETPGNEEGNNIASTGQFAVTGGGPLPDLTINNFIALVEEEPFVAFNATISNQGTAEAGPSKLGIFFQSTPPTSGAGANIVVPVPALSTGGGAAVQIEVRVLFPIDGNFNAFAFIDTDNEVAESDGNNNVSAGAPFILPNPISLVAPDLVVPALIARTRGANLVQYIAYVRNVGQGFAEESQIGIFHDLPGRPSDGTEAPILINVKALQPGEQTVVARLVGGVAPGVYRAWGFADPNDEVNERFETNNAGGAGGTLATQGVLYSVTGGGGPNDMFITNFDIQVDGTEITPRVTVRNNGPAFSPPVQLGFFDNRRFAPVQDLGGALISTPNRTFTVPTMAPGALQEFSFPSFNLNGGFYSPWVYIDGLDGFAESDEGNQPRRLNTVNRGSAPGGVAEVVGGSPLPDLTILIDSIDVEGFDATYNFTVTNEGDAASIPTEIGLILISEEQPLDGLSSTNVILPIKGLNPGEEVQATMELNGLFPGQYRSWGWVDPLESVPESDEGADNNATEAAFNYPIPSFGTAQPDRPDLRVKEFIITGNIEGFVFDIGIENVDAPGVRALDAPASVLEIRFNPQPPLPPLVGNANRMRINVPAIPRNGVWRRFNIATPRLAAPGSYALRAEVDITAVVDEANEVNNVSGITENRTGAGAAAASAIVGFRQIGGGVTNGIVVDPGGTNPADGPDLQVDALFVDVKGTGVSFDVALQNRGTVGTPATSLGIYFDRASAPGVGDEPDLVLPVPALDAGGVEFIQGVRVGSPTGGFTAFAFVDPDNDIVETFEDNNVSLGESYTVSEPTTGNTVTFTSSEIPQVPLTIEDGSGTGFPLLDLTGRSGGRTSFTRFFDTNDASMNVTAPATHLSRNFVRWVDGSATELGTDTTLEAVTITDGLVIEAQYDGGPIANFPNGLAAF